MTDHTYSCNSLNMETEIKRIYWNLLKLSLKVAFFQKVRFVFQISKSPKKKLFQKTFLDLKFKFPANFSILFFLKIWRFEKQIALSERKPPLKVPFFQKVRFVFQISQKNYSKKLSWAWNLNKLFTDMDGNFKFQAQDSFLE